MNIFKLGQPSFKKAACHTLTPSLCQQNYLIFELLVSKFLILEHIAPAYRTEPPILVCKNIIMIIISQDCHLKEKPNTCLSNCKVWCNLHQRKSYYMNIENKQQQAI